MSHPVIRKADVKHMLPHRELVSHKGENGRVLVIGGSVDYFGAPILAALGALYSGCDLVRILVPKVNFDVTRSYYPDFIVHSYEGDYLNDSALTWVKELLPKIDTILIGPGISESPEIIETIKKIIVEAAEHGDKKITIVLDAEAIAGLASMVRAQGEKAGALDPEPSLLSNDVGARIVITPNLHEFRQMIVEDIPDETHARAELVQQYADNWGVTVLLKGVTDTVSTPRHQAILNETGNAGMTVGGSGDVLAGVVASLMAQHISNFSAAQVATYVLGTCGELLESSKDFSYTATDLALELPYVIKALK